MNVTQPVASSLGSVQFGALSSSEIRQISAKQIHNPETFDTLLHPVPGGLYDLALGAWADYTCTTCDLKTFACPGHPGHIELPLPIYHSMYMDQVVRLLQSQCPYCFHFRIPRVAVNRYVCKLRLLQYGLILESRQVDDIEHKVVGKRALQEETGGMDVEDAEVAEQDILTRQLRFVRRSIAKAGLRGDRQAINRPKSAAVYEERRIVLIELLEELPKPTKCSLCKGAPYRWRKNKYNKIFRDTRLSKKKERTNLQGKLPQNPLLLTLEARKAASLEKKADLDADEGIDIESNDSDVEAAAQDATLTTGVNVSAAVASPENSKDDAGVQNEYVNPSEVHAYLEQLFRTEKELVNLMYNTYDNKKAPSISADIFFIRTLLVPPNKYRPEAKTGAGQITEAQQNTLYKRILTSCVSLAQIHKELAGEENSVYRQRDFQDMQASWITLQDNVNALFNSDHSMAPRKANQEPEEGIKQRLEKKEGLFRMNMMGKRVNFAARSVISPDPNIETNEIGVPLVFAKKLTFPEPVSIYNEEAMREAVMNGPDNYPGAVAIENENGQVISLRSKSPSERMALANALNSPSSTSLPASKKKKVQRHLRNGDIVIMNRQPTLHKPSMMCHKARVLKGEKTIRMHYANCNTYNADFDGDEMNMHFPQSQIARAEANCVADTDHQYLVATSGNPLRGLIQDHLSMGVWLTNRDTLFSRGDYQQLLYSSLRPEDNHTTTDLILTVPPAVVKPIPMWTGKQVVTTLLKNIKPATHPGLTMTGRSKTPAEAWGPGSEERDVIFDSGEFLCGILDKGQLGPSTGSLVHSVYEAYGHTVAGKLLSVLGRLLTKFLHMRGWSCGIEDIVLSRAGNVSRLKTIEEVGSIGLEVAAKYVSLPQVRDPDSHELRVRLADVIRDQDKHAGLDSVTSTRNAKLSTAITEACLPDGLYKPFPRNQMALMTTTGAKGTQVNANQISCNLGQQTLEGRRVPVMVSGKTLPSFKPLETDVRAGGYIVNRFLTGIQPSQYYFHTMAGREGLIDTAVKTARSGYLQRCLIKGMEGLRVAYDTSVRDSDGGIIQFLYGEDGLDITKQKRLQDFKFVSQNAESFALNLNLRRHKSRFDGKSVAKVEKKGRKKGSHGPIDPIISLYNPGSTLGAVSDSFAEALRRYLADPKGLQACENISVKGFQSLMKWKYLHSVVEPGEACGLVAGQSIGEPSTQMTLNTFHLAGHAAKNVTLGIPRLREIVMTASAKIATPTMTLALDPEFDDEMAAKCAKGLSKLSLAEVIESVQVTETIQPIKQQAPKRSYRITLNLYPKNEIEYECGIRFEDVANAIEQQYIKNLTKAVTKDVKAKVQAENEEKNADVGIAMRSIETQAVSSGGADDLGNAEATERAQDEVDSDDERNPDDDAMQAKSKKKAVDNYEDEDDENDDAQSMASSIEDDGPHEIPEDEGYVGSDDPDDTSTKETASSAMGKRIMDKNDNISQFRISVNSSKCEITYELDIRSPKVIMLNHVEATCHATLIQHIPGIGACTPSKEKLPDPDTKEEVEMPVVITQGINLVAIREYQDFINPRMILTNDIHAMLKYYGVEAARMTIIREMSAVFEGHSIEVDHRHLNLIADMMTRHGTFVPFNRYGMKSSTSPFMRMSFETTVGFLKDSVLSAERDDLTNPSARLVVGKTSAVGTGAFDVLLQVNADDENEVLTE